MKHAALFGFLFGALGATAVVFIVGKGWMPEFVTGGLMVVDPTTNRVIAPASRANT